MVNRSKLKVIEYDVLFFGIIVLGVLSCCKNLEYSKYYNIRVAGRT